MSVPSETCLSPGEHHPILEGYTSYAVCSNCNRMNRGGFSRGYGLDKQLSLIVVGISKDFWSFGFFVVEISLGA